MWFGYNTCMPAALLLGSRNPARVEITRQALSGLPVRLLTLDEAGVHGDAVEDGSTAAENARLKALFYYRASRLPTLAMDGALHIDRFPEDKQPGVLVRRVKGRWRTDQELMAYYAGELAAVGGESPARWHAGYAIALGEHQVIVESFVFEVLMSAQPTGQAEPGHPLDPLMRDPASGKPYTQISMQEMPYFWVIREVVERVLPQIDQSQ